MCGIAGAVSKKENIEKVKHAVERMNESQKLRGPDDFGFKEFSKGNSVGCFGHRRLALIDLTPGGHQPMSYAAESLEIIFNGEIYNFADIKKELLDLGFAFSTKSDTEVILAGYKAWGIEVFKKLRGMFALAIWDNENGDLILARDRFGIKPLYFYNSLETLVFASTVKALKESTLAPKDEEEDWKIAFLLFGFLPHPLTTLKYVKPLDPGTVLIRHAGGNIDKIRFFDPLDDYLNKINISKSEAVELVRDKLQEAVNLHLISDAPIGVFLSGGVDSSVVAALAKAGGAQKLKTLSIDFEESEFSEKKYRDRLVGKLGGEHREQTVSAEDFQNELKNIFEAIDQPTIDGVNTYFISKVAKQNGLTAVLSGLGSDEFFFGYKHYRQAKKFRFIQNLPKLLKFPLKFAEYLGGKFSRLIYFYQGGALGLYLAIRGLYSPREVSKILNIKELKVCEVIQKVAEANGLNNPKISKLASEDLISFLELRFYLLGQLLKDSDFMSMRHSLELRVPFLDNELISLLSKLPPSLKFGKVNKDLLVEATKDVLSEEVWNRPKMGFTFPFAIWLNKAGIKKTAHWSKDWAIYQLKNHIF